MRSDVRIVLLSLQLLVQGGFLVEIVNENQKQNENQVVNTDARLPVSCHDRLKAPRQMLGSKTGDKITKILNERKEIKLPTYNIPVDEISRNEKVWSYVDSPQNLIPIPRAPSPTFGQVVPKPQVWYKDEFFFKVSPTFNISTIGPSNYILSKAVSRYNRLTNSCSRLSSFSRFSLPRSISDEEVDENLHAASQVDIKFVPRKLDTHLYGPDASEFTLFPPCPNHKPHSLAIECLQIAVESLGDFWPSAEMNESYSLMVDSDGVKIIAKEVWGAIRALETFSQLLWCSPSGSSIFINRTFINDFPTFSHRGLHLDTARHFISKRNILVNLEAMAFSKFNVFHWHIVDDQSFPFASKTFPELHKKAAFHPKMIYTHADIKEIIEFARVRGIRVIPEFDIPGHTRSWAYSHPELFAKCYDSDSDSPYYGGLDPTKDETLDLLVKFFKEIIELFPETYLHMGFDEVEFSCLETNPHIQDYLSKHQLQTSIDAIKLFTVRLLNSIQALAKNSSMTGGKKFIFWQEAFESGLKLPSNSVIHQWKDLFSIPGYFGFPSIISKGWYLDSYFWPSEWITYYENNLFPTQDLEDVFNKNRSNSVLGGEACMWNEWQSDETVIQRIWPVVCAIAERLWNYKSPDTDEFAPRLEEMRCRLLRRGVQVGVTGGPGMCPLPPNADINTPRVFLDENVDYLSPVIDRKTDLLDFGSTNLFIFFGIVFFTFGYITSKLDLCSRFQRALKRSFRGIVQFKARKARSFQFQNAICLVLPVCFFIFMGLLLLFSANVSRTGSNSKPVD
nr:60S ribosomal protein L21 [Hymenolepis microstoma]